MKDSQSDQEDQQESSDLKELAKAVEAVDVTTADLNRAARTALTRLMETLDDTEMGRTPTGARQLATVLGILLDKLDKKTVDPMEAYTKSRFFTMSDETLEAEIVEISANMHDELWDRVVEARRKRKAGTGNGGDEEQSPKARKKARHWYQKEKWEFESE